MCDYSLEVYGTQPAREGEKYVTSRFPSGTIGLAMAGGGTTAVCVQCDTQLRLEGISPEVQAGLGVGPQEERCHPPAAVGMGGCPFLVRKITRLRG